MTAETISSQEELRKISKTLVKTTKRELWAVFVSKDVTSRGSQQHRFVNRLGQLKASQLRKREMEVNVKNVSHDELRQFEWANPNEILALICNTK